jgi:uncharacterized repeat protein (TIGR03803 family)
VKCAAQPSLTIGALCGLALLVAGCSRGRVELAFPSPTPAPPPSHLPAQDGSGPNSLILASDGNFYGTTASGGQFNRGTVFTVTLSGEETVLYSFAGGTNDGAYPQGLIQGSDGGFYGTTNDGGKGVCPRTQPAGGTAGNESACGTVFRVTAEGEEQVLYFFTGEADGGEPNGGLVQDSNGNLYGTTASGGNTSEDCGAVGCGVVFQLTLTGTESVLHAFAASTSDGALPTSLMLGIDGNLYGTTQLGGRSSDGTVFQVTLAGEETILYSFRGGRDGMYPAAALVEGTDGMLYGTTPFGGASTSASPLCTGGCGTVYSISLAGTETVLYAFGGGNRNGANPYGPMIQGSDGNFYGTTDGGGSGTCSGGCGTVFQITPAGVETALYSFASATDGVAPSTGLVQSANGNFYGVTMSGGALNDGTVFSITPQGIETVLYSFGTEQNP